MQTDMKESQAKMGSQMEGSSRDVKAIVDEWRDCGEASGISEQAQRARGELGAVVDEWRDCGEAEAAS